MILALAAAALAGPDDERLLADAAPQVASAPTPGGLGLATPLAVVATLGLAGAAWGGRRWLARAAGGPTGAAPDLAIVGRAPLVGGASVVVVDVAGLAGDRRRLVLSAGSGGTTLLADLGAADAPILPPGDGPDDPTDGPEPLLDWAAALGRAAEPPVPPAPFTPRRGRAERRAEARPRAEISMPEDADGYADDLLPPPRVEPRRAAPPRAEPEPPRFDAEPGWSEPAPEPRAPRRPEPVHAESRNEPPRSDPPRSEPLAWREPLREAARPREPRSEPRSVSPHRIDPTHEVLRAPRREARVYPAPRTPAPQQDPRRSDALALIDEVVHARRASGVA